MRSYKEQQAWESLMNRNQKLVAELTRVQNENRLLRKKINSMTIMHLTAAASKVDCFSQTDDLFNDKKPINRLDRHKLDLQIQDVLQRSPSIVTPKRNGNCNAGEDSIIYSSCECGEDSGFVKVRSKRRDTVISNPKSFVCSPKAESPCQERVSAKLKSKVLTPINKSEKSSLNPDKNINDDLDLQNKGLLLCESPTNVNYLGNSRRNSRSIKKPISYQEPSLRAKVRKGFEFFKFK